MEQTKIGVGILLLAVSSTFLFFTGGFDATLRMGLAVGAVVGLAAGSVLIGTAQAGRPA